MRPLVFLFGGQSSRDPEMLERLSAVDPVLGKAAQACAGKLDLETNAGIQIGVHATTIGWLSAVRAKGLVSTASAGLSLGEYAHLVDIGAIEPQDCAELVRQRGQLYDDGPSGCMAAIYPCDSDELAALIAEADVEVAVYNSPTQTVVGGTRDAVQGVMELADQELFCLSTMIEDHIPMHTQWFKDVAPKLGQVLEQTKITPANQAYWPNVTATPTTGSPSKIREALQTHVYEPVRWRQTVDALVLAHPEAVFLEVGPRTVLSDLMKRKWHGDRDIFCVDTLDGDPQEHFLATMHEVKHALG